MASVKCLLVIIGLAAMTFGAADTISGSWQGSMELNGGSEQTACMTVKQEGAVLSGTAGSCEGKQFAITRGTVNGDLITIEAHPGAPTLKFAMRVDGNKLTGEVFEDDQKIGTISMEKAAK